MQQAEPEPATAFRLGLATILSYPYLTSMPKVGLIAERARTRSAPDLEEKLTYLLGDYHRELITKSHRSIAQLFYGRCHMLIHGGESHR